MKSFGTLYHHSMKTSRGSIILNQRSVKGRARFTQVLGAGMTSIAMAMFVYTYGPAVSSELPASGVETSKVTNASVLESAFTPIEVTATNNADSSRTEQSFTLNIPFLGVSTNVIENVDPGNEIEYKAALELGVAHASGTGFPGEGKRIFLFAHSTNSILNFSRYNAIFYNLNNISNGERILIHRNGKNYTYEVTTKRVVPSSDTQWLKSSEGEELILQTCYPPGTNWKRLLVFAKLI